MRSAAILIATHPNKRTACQAEIGRPARRMLSTQTAITVATVKKLRTKSPFLIVASEGASAGWEKEAAYAHPAAEAARPTSNRAGVRVRQGSRSARPTGDPPARPTTRGRLPAREHGVDILDVDMKRGGPDRDEAHRAAFADHQHRIADPHLAVPAAPAAGRAERLFGVEHPASGHRRCPAPAP